MTTSRRKRRFVATLRHVETGIERDADVLIYPDRNGEADLRHFELLTSEVWYPVQIVPKNQRRAELSSDQPWKLDDSAISEVVNTFVAPTIPLRIELEHRFGGRSGCYTLKRATSATKKLRADLPEGCTLFHHIKVKSWLSAEAATATLHHELEHAAQAERAFHGERTDFKRLLAWGYDEGRSREIRYRDRPCEIGARKAAIERSSLLPLTRPVSSATVA